MSRITLARYRMDKAKENLRDAKEVLTRDRFSLSVNRSYYTMFMAARGLLSLKGLDSSKHSGVIALFNQHIIKAGFFPKELSRLLPKAKLIRENADYGDFTEITEEDAKNQLENAKKFLEEAERTMQEMGQEPQ